jgi:GWxTD domain-containing protein
VRRTYPVISRALLIASLAAGLINSPSRAQEPADRTLLEDFQDSLLTATDTVPLVALERKLVDQARTDRDNAVLHMRIGLVNLRIGALGGKWRYEDAASEFNWATELKPDWPWGWYGMGLAELGVGDPEIALLAGLQNMFGKDHLTRSAMAFARSAQVDPSFVRGLVELASTALRQRINIKLDMAREALRIAAATAAARNPEVLLYRGRVEREVGDIDSSIVSFKAYIDSASTNHGLGRLELARSQFVKGDLAGNVSYFEGAASDDSTAVGEYRKDLAYIATDSTLREFDQARGQDRSNFLRTFWQERDRMELRPDGERLREHYRRIQYARRNFALVSTKRHYDISERYRSNSADFDDRGLMYIRHGEPSERASLHLPGVELNETWKYSRVAGDLVFHFVAREDVQDFKLVESLYDVFGFQAALQVQTGSTMGPDSNSVQQLLESRERIDPLYSRLQGASRAGLVTLANQERRLGQRSIATGAHSDTYELEFPQKLTARTDVMAVGREGQGNLLQVTWAIPGSSLKGIPHEQGFLYPVRIRINVTDNRGHTVASLDTTKVFLSRAEVPARENLVDRVSLVVPAGTLRYRIAMESQQGTGTITPIDSIQVGEFDGQSFTVSSVVLGWKNANLRWLPQPADTVYFNPTGTYRQNSEMELYYEVYGLPKGTPYQVELRVARRDGGRAAMTLKYEEHADSVVTRSRRSVVLDKVRQGEYIMHLIITTPDGRREERRAAFQVNKEQETANR